MKTRLNECESLLLRMSYLLSDDTMFSAVQTEIKRESWPLVVYNLALGLIFQLTLISTLPQI